MSTDQGDLKLLSKARGTLIAAACGDALGGPLELMGKNEIRRNLGQVRDFIGGGWLSLSPGEVTDDTQMMLEVARSIATLGRVDPQDITTRLVEWMNSNPKDIDHTVFESLSLIRDGTPIYEASKLVIEREGFMNGSRGNGCLIPCVPIALLLYKREQALVKQTRSVASITHANPVCQWAAVALNMMISELLRGRFEQVVVRVADKVPQPEISEMLRSIEKKSEDDLDNSGDVLATLESAIWAFGNTSSLEDAIIKAANLGGDADTRAAVTGALAGAHYGIESIPQRWLERLEPAQELIVLAEQIVRTSR
ncbi:ADP-ribosyl-(dinitrogen reductase) hydrolase [Thermobaculum terrenum ATCC BAA-798]|uniref:ADP-ribosyl-(Dinitrogen reductase) hydrolase n=1 Tax=Thermobaculum terrenum (strain ATCC BAA-798 / CCMEE 7001 / YNP1) TaxID=525904 RepID=D1CEA4_THET1|nr:ADP-ribosylglycohydrolase family protein [Thermobaculum terrenum]ACZ41260.1 ADP-ribosyl-(dinitrogen reductase) hydrolase [Thermobaculum terrenum ATCC BAA-798]